jgi:hypothetical protein
MYSDIDNIFDNRNSEIQLKSDIQKKKQELYRQKLTKQIEDLNNTANIQTQLETELITSNEELQKNEDELQSI